MWYQKITKTDLDGAGQDVAIVGQAGGEGGPVVKGVLGPALGLLQGALERVKILPQLEDVLFFLPGQVGRRQL